MDLRIYTDSGRNRLYRPLPKQLAFHTSPAKFRAYIGGFASGKTLAGCVEAVKMAVKYPGSRGLVGRLTEDELKRTTWGTLLAVLPHELIKTHVHGDFYIQLKNGSEIQGMHLQDEAKLRSENLDWVYIDEGSEIKEVIWKQLMGRLRGKLGAPLKMWVTSNPEGRNWMYRRFVLNIRPDHAYFHAPTWENPYLPDGYVESLRQNYDEEWVRKFLDGSWDVFEGQVFPLFDPDLHVLDWEPEQIPKEWPRYRGIDHGWDDPMVCLWAAKDFEGNIYFYNCLYRKRVTIEANCRTVQEMSAGEQYEWSVIDPNTNKRDPITGRMLADIYRENGIFAMEADQAIDTGIARMREMMQPDPNRKHPITGEFGAPKFYVLHHLKEMKWELQQYRYPNSDDSKNAPKKPIDAHNHTVDAARYIINRDPMNAEKQTGVSMADYMEHLLDKRSSGGIARAF